MLEDYLTNEVENWAVIGHPALMQRFVLRNGQRYGGRRRIGRRGMAKQCFMNATKRVLHNPRAYIDGWRYVEGYAIHRTDPIMAIHHAWVTTNGSDAMDPTLDATKYDYFGVAFDKPTLVGQLRQQKYYGMLDTGLGLNWQLMFELDPELRTIVEKIKPIPAWEREVALCE